MKIGAGTSKGGGIHPVLILFFVFNLFFLLNCSFSGRRLKVVSGNTMGTTYTVKIVYDKSQRAPQQKLFDKIDSLLVAINKIMSTHDPQSTLSRFNRASTEWFGIPPELLIVVKRSNQISRLSNGAFDVTVAPLVDLWGFGKSGMHRTVPSSQQIAKAKRRVGYRYLRIRNDPPALKKFYSNVECNLSAIAKGYGVDRIANMVDKAGYANYMVEIGGEVFAHGRNVQNAAWRIGISQPNAFATVHCIVKIENRAVATSGDYRNYFEKDGIRYSHTIDPRTGRPIDHKLASVTVIDTTCMMADAWATAIDVLGPEAGYKLAKENNLAVYMLIRDNDTFINKMTPLFAKFYSTE